MRTTHLRLAALALAALAACTHPRRVPRPAEPTTPTTRAPRPPARPEPAQPAEPPARAAPSPHAAQEGLASFYGGKFHGRRTASGARYDQTAMTCAHRTLPFGTRVRVTELAGGRSVVVTVNDRGPFVKGRVIDLSRAAAKKLGFLHTGLARVRVERLEEERAGR